MPVTETQMAISPEPKRRTQLSLFQESHPAPFWGDLSCAAHVEAVRILAQLLLEVRAGKATRTTQESEAL
jgi:hypothetical protein